MHHSNIATLAAIVHSLKQHYINRGNGIYSHLNFCKAHLALLFIVQHHLLSALISFEMKQQTCGQSARDKCVYRGLSRASNYSSVAGHLVVILTLTSSLSSTCRVVLVASTVSYL